MAADITYIAYITEGHEWPMVCLCSSGVFSPMDMTSEKLKEILRECILRLWGDRSIEPRERLMKDTFHIYITKADTPGMVLENLIDPNGSKADPAIIYTCDTVEEFDEWLSEQRRLINEERGYQ